MAEDHEWPTAELKQEPQFSQGLSGSRAHLLTSKIIYLPMEKRGKLPVILTVSAVGQKHCEKLGLV